MTVVAGYIRMLLKDRAGPLSDQQRKLLEEAEKSCTRLSALLVEMSDLSNLEAGTASFNRSGADLISILKEAIAALPELPDRSIEVELQVEGQVPPVQADPVRLRTALSSVLAALRRELVSSPRLVVRARTADGPDGPRTVITIADPDHIDALSTADESTLATFDEWRGGVGLSLGIARRILEAHGGHIWSPVSNPKGGAILSLPQR